MVDVPKVQQPDAHSLRSWAAVAVLLGGATLTGLLLDPYVSLTSQAMIYVLAIVIGAYKLDWVHSAVCAVGAVTALNFFFVPPRLTFDVESEEHLIALFVMLVVALVISHLAAGVRRESRSAALNEQRARQLQALASDLAMVGTPQEVVVLGRRALDLAFDGPNLLVLSDAQGQLSEAGDLPDNVLDGLRCCMTECAVLGPGTGRWPGLNAWLLPLGDAGQVVGAARVLPASSGDTGGREHARALVSLLAQALWRMRLSNSMQAAQAEAQRQQVQSTFLAAVSHDLRTPLATIVGAASALRTQREKLAPAEQSRLLESIVSEADYLSTVTENTLQLVRLTSLKEAPKRDWESIEEIVGAVLARVRQRDTGRRIKSRVRAALPLLKADPVLLAQMIENLLDNALKYSDGEIELDVHAGGQHLFIEVKDRGAGIEEAQHDLIFEPYRRGDQSGQRGAGLGLALCRAIAQAHLGTLTHRPRRAGGTCFCVTLPLDEPQPVAEQPT